MKFMKLGSRPDTFYSTEAVRSISSEVSSDLIIQVKGCRYLLHKFPLLSKCLRLQRLCSESAERQAVQLPDFPGGDEAFDLCAKFCYGITITLSAYNVAAARCAAEYLQMTEEAERGNLVRKIDAFLGSCILAGWRDSIVALQTTKSLPHWSEELGITARCIDAVASKILANPSRVALSRSRSRQARGSGGPSVSVGVSAPENIVSCSARGWWAEDLAELEMDLYWRTMIAVKSGGRVPPSLVGDALKVYAARWLPRNGCADGSDSDMSTNVDSGSKRRLLLESIVSLLPQERGAVSCGFLLELLKAGSVLTASSASRAELERRAALQLEEASVGDLLVPGRGSRYDVDVVIRILERFMLHGQGSPPRPRPRLGTERRRRSQSAESIDFELQESRRSFSAPHGSKLKVAKLVDGYLQEIAGEADLCPDKFIAVAEAVPDFSRADHDDLYRAIDIYLKAHPEASKSERKRVCRSLDCKKLSMDACMHAAQNEVLPLRVVVQVLFFEQARAATATATMCVNGEVGHHELPSNIRALLASHGIDPSNPADDQWSTASGLLKSPHHKVSTLRMKLAEDHDHHHHHHHVIINSADGIGRSSSSSRLKAICALPTRPKKMLSKLRSSANRTPSEKI